MERSRRATNPDNYEPVETRNFASLRGNKVVKKKGKLKPGARQRVRSVRYQTAAAKKRELERRKAAYAKSQNRRLVNEILRHGNHIRTERVSVKGWQKRYGKAIGAKSPGFFQSELKRKVRRVDRRTSLKVPVVSSQRFLLVRFVPGREKVSWGGATG